MRRKHNSIPKLHLKKGDKVIVLSGNDKGKTGDVLEVLPKERRVIVDGVNVRKKHQKPSAQDPEGGIKSIALSIDISNVAFVDPKSGEPTRVGRKQDNNGKLVRYAKKSGEVID